MIGYVFPKVNPKDKNHYLSFNELKGSSPTETELPELATKTKPHPWKLSGKHARAKVECIDCQRPRIVYCKTKLDRKQKSIIENINALKSYRCGSILNSDGMYINWNLTCDHPISSTHYKHPEWGLRCHHCACTITDADALNEFGQLTTKYGNVLMSCNSNSCPETITKRPRRVKVRGPVRRNKRKHAKAENIVPARKRAKKNRAPVEVEQPILPPLVVRGAINIAWFDMIKPYWSKLNKKE